MKETDENEAQGTEEKILASAEREFMLKGYAGARTSSIAESAGVTHAMLHYYFRTKDKLFDRIIESKIGTLRDIMLASVGDPSTPLFDKLESAIVSHLDFIAANPLLPGFMIGEVFGRPEKLALVIDQLRRHAPLIVASLQSQIDEYAARGECRRVDAAMLMLDIVSLNIFSFMAAPMVNTLLGGIMADRDAFIESRKKENVETIMRKLKP